MPAPRLQMTSPYVQMEIADHCHRCLIVHSSNAASRRFFRVKVVASGRSQRRFCGDGGRALPARTLSHDRLEPNASCSDRSCTQLACRTLTSMLYLPHGPPTAALSAQAPGGRGLHDNGSAPESLEPLQHLTSSRDMRSHLQRRWGDGAAACCLSCSGGSGIRQRAC